MSESAISFWSSAFSHRLTGAVLVVGGGVAGIQASLDLAELGYRVYLVEASPAIGGAMAQLDKTFPTLDCSLCILSPKLVDCGRHRNIEILTNAQIEGVQGEAGHFLVQVLKRPKYVREDLCNACGFCSNYCPVRIPDAYNENLSLTKSLHIPYPQAVPSCFAIDPQTCLFLNERTCKQCEQACRAKAIDFNQREERLWLEVGAILLAPGFEEFDARLKGAFGYGRYPNVVSSIEFERILCASGPYAGRVLRPSDGGVVHRLAFIQCVGSRDVTCQNPYCSTVCCMYAIKEAILAKEHDPALDVSIFFTDMRTPGKGFEDFLARARNEFGVRFIRSQVSSIMRLPQEDMLAFRYMAQDGKLEEGEFDVVVLSVGMEPPRSAVELAAAMDIVLNRYGFCQTNPFAPLLTTRPGIFVAGAFQGPKDIPDTVAQASGATALASGLLAPSRGSLTEEKEYPPEMDVAGQKPRIGVFVCHCGNNIAGVVDVPAVREHARTLANVVYVEDNLYSCSQDTQERIKEAIRENRLNRIIVAACTPRTHEPLFQETMREAGLNRALFEMANIRDQCSWVHIGQKEAATEKAKDLVGMAVAKARLLEPLPERRVEVVPRGLIIGGGLSGMTAAVALAYQGFECYLVEKEGELGGHFRRLYHARNGDDPRQFLEELTAAVEENELIHVYTHTQVKEVAGFIGNFKTTLMPNCEADQHPRGQPPPCPTLNAPREQWEIEHGVVIVATGAEEYQPREYLYGQDPRVVTQSELEAMLAMGGNELGVTSHEVIGDEGEGIHNAFPLTPRSVVMIQCVGSRNGEHPYCSKVCCAQAIENAIKIKELHPSCDIYLLYRDIRTYGFREELYREARSKGVIFIRYDDEHPPEVRRQQGGQAPSPDLQGASSPTSLEVRVFDPILGETVVLPADLLILSAAIVPRGGNASLAKMLHVPLTNEGFFLEAHVKLRPVAFATDGVYLCGLAHSPRPADESIVQAQAAAAQAAIPLTKGYVSVEPIIASVDGERCIGCALCESLCAFSAIRVKATHDGSRAEVIGASCKGCGVCAARCPKRAITMGHFTDAQVFSQIAALSGTSSTQYRKWS